MDHSEGSFRVRSRLSAEFGRRLAAGLAALLWVSPLGAQEPLPGRSGELPVSVAIPPQPSPSQDAPAGKDWGFRWDEHPVAAPWPWHADRLPRAPDGRPSQVRGRARRSFRLRRGAAPRRHRGPDRRSRRLSGRVQNSLPTSPGGTSTSTTASSIRCKCGRESSSFPSASTRTPAVPIWTSSTDRVPPRSSRPAAIAASWCTAVC